MKLYIFGSCSGTEPMENRHHTALAFEINGRFYWFDAGENCSYTAHTMGLDLLAVSDIFISHPHMDHIGGLANLLWNIKKLTWVKKAQPQFGDVNIYISQPKTVDTIVDLLRNAEGGFNCNFRILPHQITGGSLFKNADMEVSALQNNHLPNNLSYSFCIKAENKKIVYSGDIKAFDELLPFLDGKTDLLLMETGHHSAPDICKQIKDKNLDIQKVIFMHHGREILADAQGVLTRCKEIFPETILANDKDIFEL